MASHMHFSSQPWIFFPSHPTNFLSPPPIKNKLLCFLLDYIQILYSVIIMLSDSPIVFHYYHNCPSKYNNIVQE